MKPALAGGAELERSIVSERQREDIVGFRAHNQKMTVVTSAIAERSALEPRSLRVASLAACQ